MLSFSKSKKGVSPLIATILLIAFAVALGSVVMNWGLNLNLGKSDDKCGEISIKVREFSGYHACFGGSGQEGYINFILDNTGSSDVNGLTILMVGEKGTRLFELDSTIGKNSLYDKTDKTVGYDFSTYGSIKKVQFIPKVKSGQETEVCTRSAVEADKIGICG